MKISIIEVLIFIRPTILKKKGIMNKIQYNGNLWNFKGEISHLTNKFKKIKNLITQHFFY